MNQNQDEKVNHSENNQFTTNEMVSQEEDLSPDEKITSSLQAGINYCRFMSEQMHNEVKKLQEKLDYTRQNNKVLKQNIVNLDTEKQKLIYNFQEEFRKFNTLNNYIIELEEEIQNIKEFLENSLKLEEDISQSKIEELKIRSNVQVLFEEKEMELQKIESFVQNQKDYFEKRVDEIQSLKTEQTSFQDAGDQLILFLHLCEKKINSLKSMKNIVHDFEDIKQRITSLRIDGDIQVENARSKMNELPRQVSLEINSLRSQNICLKNKIQAEYEEKRTIFEDLKKKLQREINERADVDWKIEKENLDVENMEKEKKINKEKISTLKIEIIALKHEEKSVQEAFDDLTKKIQTFQDRQKCLIEEQKQLQEDMGQLKKEKENLEQTLEIQENKIHLEKKLDEINLLNVIHEKECKELEEKIQQLTQKKNCLDEENLSLNRQIQAEKKRISAQEELWQKNRLPQNLLKNENTELLDQLRLMKAEEYSLAELKDLELNDHLEKFKEIFLNFVDSEFSLSQLQKENNETDENICARRKKLKTITDDNEVFKGSIQRIKQNVYNGTYVTMQELNKKYNLMVNGKNVETERVEKLKQEISNLKERLNSKQEIFQDNKSNILSSHHEFRSKVRKTKKY